jgi:hypothetical protein
MNNSGEIFPVDKPPYPEMDISEFDELAAEGELPIRGLVISQVKAVFKLAEDNTN